MKLLVKKLLFFLFPFFLLFIYVEKKLYDIHEHRVKKINFENQLDSIELLILGSSHSELSINPRHLTPKTYNLAMGGQSIYYSCALIEKYLHKIPKLRIIMLETSYLFLYLDTKIKSKRNISYYYFWNVKKPNYPVLKIENFLLVANYSPKNIIGSVFSTLSSSIQEFKVGQDGWIKKDSNGSFKNTTDKFGLKTLEQMKNEYINSSDILENTISLIKKLKDRNITLILIDPPVHKER